MPSTPPPAAAPVFLPDPPPPPGPDSPVGRPSWLVALAVVVALAVAVGAAALLARTGAVSGPVDSDAVTTLAPQESAADDAADPAGPVDAAEGSSGDDPSADDGPPTVGDGGIDPEAPVGDAGASAGPGDDASSRPADDAAADASGEEQPAEPQAPDVPEPQAPDVPESRAVIRNGQIYLEGAVPTQEASDEIEALAAEILGADNVINDYVIDDRAGDPNLGNITVEDTINFATGSAQLLPEAEGLLNQGLALMTIRPAVTIEIVGHTDSRGAEDYNQLLSEQRADEVKNWFVVRGIDESRLVTSGAGESEPIADNATAEGRRLNRRIQFFLQNVLADG